MHFYFVEGCVFLFTFLLHFDFYFHSSLLALLMFRKQCRFDLNVFLKLPSLQRSIGMTCLFQTRSNVHVPYEHENVCSEWNFQFCILVPPSCTKLTPNDPKYGDFRALCQKKKKLKYITRFNRLQILFSQFVSVAKIT